MRRLIIAFLFVSLANASDMGERLISAGWCYNEPRPKSAQAAHGNYDGRTTWWIGYWVNASEKECSEATPRYLPQHNIVVGDGRECRDVSMTYRRGGYIPMSGLEKECSCQTDGR